MNTAAPTVDVVVVSYNSRDHLRACVEPLAALPGVNAIVVDNASSDDSVASLAGLDVQILALEDNRGFAHGCNAGFRAGAAPCVLFLNPDAIISGASIDALVAVFDQESRVALAAPRIVDADGSLDFSQRRRPRARSTFAQALFLHRLFPQATWTDELVREPGVYARRGSPDWASGAALMARRSVLEELGGWDEGFFMYGEDMDLCKRVQDAGYELRFEPAATVTHAGGASAPRASLLPVLAASRIRYAHKHRGRTSEALERTGIAIGSLTRMAVSPKATREGHARALRTALSRPDRTS